MTSFKVKYKPSAIKGREGSVYYQVIHDRKVKVIHTNYRVLSSEWNEKQASVHSNPKSPRFLKILSIRERIRWDKERFSRILDKFERTTFDYSVEELVEAYHRNTFECSLCNYMENLVAKLRLTGRIRTSETYKSALSSFMKFRENEDILLNEITTQTIDEYQGWLQNLGVRPNTISFYMRILRAVYNRAVDDDKIDDRRPFRHAYTGIDKTVKRALPIRMIRKIRKLDLDLFPALDFARDMFMLSFMLRGMNFIDMAFLRKTDLADGVVHYRRRKTGQPLSIEWTKEMQSILMKYPDNDSDYLFPILRKTDKNLLSHYRNVASRVNYCLKRIAVMVGVSIPLTLYVARHSWASAASATGIPTSVISQGMGHDSELTTRIYLASLDTSVVNRANRRIIAAI